MVLPEGEVVLEVSHPDYATAQCGASVPSGHDLRARPPPASMGSSGFWPSTAKAIRCPRSPSRCGAPSEHRLISDEAGVAVVEALEPGAYTAHVDDPVYLIAVADLDILARQETTVQLRVLVKPSRPSVVIRKKEIALRRQVSFATGSDEILPNSEPPPVRGGRCAPTKPQPRVGGDSRAIPTTAVIASSTCGYPSDVRKAVQRWLIQHGVESTRLMAKGYGPTRPIAPNITQQKSCA